MPPAAKHLDPILGIDVHIIQPPPPAPPLPVPHPHTGIVLDPFDYAPIVGGTVKVGGLQRAQAGTGTKMVPVHFPIGGTFVKPPGNEGEIFMGSSTVAADGDAFSYLALPVLTCQDIGIPAPGRPKGSPPKSLVLPTTVVLSIPLPVQVGGGPTVSLMALGMRAGLAALGGALKKLKSLDAVASKLKKFSDAVHAKAGKLMKKLGIPPNLQRKVHDKICSVTGHPVDIASGKVMTAGDDLHFYGPIEFRLKRAWYSSSTYRGDFGHGWHHPYDMALFMDDDVVLARLADGRHVAFPTLALDETVFHPQERLTLGRDAQGYWLRDTEGLTYRFSAGSQRRLAVISDDAGHRVVFIRGARGQLEAMIDCAGRRLNVDTDSEGRVVRIDAPHPDNPRRTVTVARYHYDDDGDLVRHDDALGHTTHYAYKDHKLVTETHPGGLAFHFEYEGPRCVKTWGTGGIYGRTLVYDDIAGTTAVTDSRGNTTIHRHDGAVVYEREDPYGNVDKTEYNEHYWVTATTDAAGRTTRYKYDDRGNQIEVQHPDGTSVRAEYNDADRLTRYSNEMGVASTREYDATGRVVARTNPLGRVEITRSGQQEIIVDEAGGTTVVEHDAAFNVVSLRLPDGSVTTWDYDAWGRPVRAISPTGAFEQRSYDLLGHPQRIHDLEGNRTDFEFDAAGQPVRIKHHNREVKIAYTGMGRILRRSEGGVTLGFSYDSEENVTAIIDGGGGARRFEYDANNLASSRTDAAGRRISFERGPTGKVVRVDRPGERFTLYAYDDADLITEVKHSDGTAQQFRYRPDGQIVEASNDTTSVSFERDELGQIVRESAGGHWVASTYEAGFRTGISSSLGADQKITRTTMGDVAAVQDGAFEAGFGRDVFGSETERSLPGQIRCRRTYDKLGREVEQEILRGDTTLRTRACRWGGDSQLAEVTDSLRGATRYGHDVLGSLAWAQHPGQQTQLRMPDACGNLYETEDRTDRGYGPTGEVQWTQTEEGRTEFRYDVEGQLAERIGPGGERWAYAWDHAGQLTSVTRPDGEEVRFTYDAIGRRLTKEHAGEVHHTLWDQHAPLHEWTTSDDAPSGDVTAWLFEPDTLLPMGKRVGDDVFSIVCDRLGTPQVMFDAAGEATWTADIDAYGNLLGLEGDAEDCPFRWPGQREDAETGLHYNRYRYYDPSTGVYISPDPIRELGGLRPYGYVGDVLTDVDPFGLKSKAKTTGDIAEKSAKKRLYDEGYDVLGSMENTSGHGVDIVARNPNGDLEVIEVKSNGNTLNPDQSKGADWFAQDRANKAQSKTGHWANPKRNAGNLAQEILDEVAEKGSIKGWVMHYKVKDGKAKFLYEEPWVKCS